MLPPPGFWYDQEANEWVVVIEGRAAVEFDGQPEPVELRRGSYLNIPAHARHRVVGPIRTRRPSGWRFITGDEVEWRPTCRYPNTSKRASSILSFEASTSPSMMVKVQPHSHS